MTIRGYRRVKIFRILRTRHCHFGRTTPRCKPTSACRTTASRSRSARLCHERRRRGERRRDEGVPVRVEELDTDGIGCIRHRCGDLLGSAVDVSGDGARVAIGSPGWGIDEASRSRRGKSMERRRRHVVYEGIGYQGERRYDGLGSSVSLSSDGMTLAIGVAGSDGAYPGDSWGEDSGKTRFFHYSKMGIGSRWVLHPWAKQRGTAPALP